MKIYNSLTRKKETFKPLRKGKVGMYVCGPTVYDEAHIGHARAAYIFEVIRNYFEYKGNKVKFVQNITDVDDKIIARAEKELPNVPINEAVKQVAKKYTQRYYQDMDELGIRRATHQPKATEHIDQMQRYIAQLVKKGFAYEAGGNVYFDVRRFKDYGQLSQQNLQQMRSNVRIEQDESKRDVLDFALWKKSKEGEPFWDSPWRRGRPGWHIECSVMAGIYLGQEFDIHAGGMDLIFPHHENEIAQSSACSGKRFAHFWMHNGLLTINGQKMAKSLGNFISVQEFLKEHLPEVLKLFFLSGHYRSPLDYNQKRLSEAKKTYERIQIFLDKLKRRLIQKKRRRRSQRPQKEVLKFKKKFEQAMDDDFNTPKAQAALFDLVSFGNKLLIDYQDKYRPALQSAQDLLEDSSQIFGLSFGEIPTEAISASKIEVLIRRREDLRKKGDFEEADRIRRQLQEKDIILEDTKEGTIWRRRI